MKQTTIRIMRLPVEGPAAVATIDNNLNAMQAEVGGLIEPVSMPRAGLDAFVNEEGLLNEEPINPHLTRLHQKFAGGVYSLGNGGLGYRGDAFVSRLNPKTGDQIDLTDEDILWLQQQIQQ